MRLASGFSSVLGVLLRRHRLLEAGLAG